MHIGITRLRLSAAGLFVAAGIGLGSILSPIVGDAFVTVGQVVNISDHSSSAFFATVALTRISVENYYAQTAAPAAIA
jgi:hypothetical protein